MHTPRHGHDIFRGHFAPLKGTKRGARGENAPIVQESWIHGPGMQRAASQPALLRKG
jgi:hypothetical protein